MSYLLAHAGRTSVVRPSKIGVFFLSLVSLFGVSTGWSMGGKVKGWARMHTGASRNLFREAGYSQADIDKKVAKAYYDVFEGPHRVYFEVEDSMAYVSDLKNHDARTEGLSYGMMIAVQLDKKDVFDRIWRWSRKYLQHQDGPREAYFAWSINPKTMKKNSEGSASDGELYYITDLLLAANRWGNNTGIHYYNEARRILDAMWKKDGTGNIYNLINTAHKQISFVPEGDGYNWTDPSYHLPAFFEIWALYSKDGHEQFYRDCADTARAFLHRACDAVTGLTTDYAEFSGDPHFVRWMPQSFRYDSWRVPMNIAMDYAWFGKDKSWQEDYARRLQRFLRSKGIDSFKDQFDKDGTTPEFILQAGGFKKLRHSLGFVSTAAAASLMNPDKNSIDFVRAVWDAKLEPYEDGYFDPYYDGLLYLFSLMHLSGKYQVIEPRVQLTTPKTHSDNGDGTYTNPVIPADFPDPDVIRVGDTYYMVTTTMFIFPGVPIIKSKDLVNWEYCSNAVPRFDFSNCYDLDTCNRYGHGQWATSLKYHNGKFYLLFITLNEGGFMCTATNSEGPWKVTHLPKGFYDPGLFFDDNGKIYVAQGYGKISITEVDSNLVGIRPDSLVYTGDIRRGLEGTHVYKINGYYYLYSTYGGRDGIQVALRSKNIYGPYEQKVVIKDTTHGINFGIHQGALIQTQTGEWWTMLFVDSGPFGRFPSLQPVTWSDGWPMVGVDGKGVITYKKPNVGKSFPAKDLPVSDEFDGATLGMQWGWNHNPDPTGWSLRARPGFLRLATRKVVANLTQARNTLTQRPFAQYDQNAPTAAVVRMDVSKMKDGDIAGLAVFQDPYAYIGVRQSDGAKYIVMVNNGRTVDSAAISTSIIYLRTIASNSTGTAIFEYSVDNKTFKQAGNELLMRFSLKIFTGNKFCLFNYATREMGGYVDFDWFRVAANG